MAHLNLALAAPAQPDAAPAISGDVHVAGLRLESLPTQAGPAWPAELASLQGLGQFRATLSGTTAEPVAQGQLDLSQVNYRDYFINSVQAPFTFQFPTEGDDYLVVKGGTLATEGAGFTFDGTLRDLFGEPNFLIRAQAKDIHLERLAAVLPTPLALAGEVFIPQITIKGSAAGVSGEGRLLAPQVSVGDSVIKGVDTHFVIDQGQVRLERTTLEAAGGSLQAELSYTLATRSWQGEVEAAEVDVAQAFALVAPIAAAREETPDAYQATDRYWQRWSVRSRGLLAASLRFQGPAEALVGTTTLNLAGATYMDRPVPDVKASLAFDTRTGTLSAINAELTSGQAFMTITGQVQRGGALALVADASNVDLAAWREWFPASLGLGGVAGVTIQAQGTTASPQITASVDVLSASLRGVAFDLVSIPVVRVAERGIDLDTIIFKRGEREVVGAGHLPFSWHPLSLPGDQPVSFTASLDNTDLSFFPPILNELTRYARRAEPSALPSPWADMTASGSVNSQVKLGGTLRQPTLEGYLRLEKGAIARPGWKTPLSELTTDLTIHSSGNGNLVQINALSGRFDQTRLAVTGSANFKTLDPNLLGNNVYNLALGVSADKQALLPGQVLTGLKGQVTFTTEPNGAQVIRFADMSGSVGKGMLALTGSANLTEFTRATFSQNDFNVALKVTNVPLDIPTVRGALDGEIHLANPTSGEPAMIRGGLTLDRAVFGIPQWSTTGGPLVYPGPGPLIPDFGLELALALGPKVTLKTPALVAPVVPTKTAAVVTGTLRRPRVDGGLQTLPRSGSLPGTTFSLRGLTFTYSIEPRSPRGRPPYELLVTGHYEGLADETLAYVEVEGRNVGPVHLIMTISGDLPRPPRIDIKAEPPLTAQQINTLVALAGLVPPGTTETSDVLSQRFANLLAVGFREALFTPIQASLQRFLGLQELSVTFSFDQPLEVRMGKYVAQDFLVSYRYSLVGPRNEYWNLALSYELTNKYRVSYGTNESGENSFRVSRGFAF